MRSPRKVRRLHSLAWSQQDGIYQLAGATRATPSASPIRTGLSEIETNPEFGGR